MTTGQLKYEISLLSKEERLEIIVWLERDYCNECGEDAFCDCESCICECRKRKGKQLREEFEKSGKNLKE